MRPIPHALNLGAPEIYGQGPTGQGTQGTQVLEDVNMASMVGTLAQLGALATVRRFVTENLHTALEVYSLETVLSSHHQKKLLWEAYRSAGAIRTAVG